MKKVDTIDEVLDEIKRVSRADDKGDWEAEVELDVTDCFRPSDILCFDSGGVLLINADAIPISGEVCDGEYCGEYELMDLRVNFARVVVAKYYTERNGDEQAAYAPGARR